MRADACEGDEVAVAVALLRRARSDEELKQARASVESAISVAARRGRRTDELRVELASALVRESRHPDALRCLDACDELTRQRSAGALLARGGALHGLGRSDEAADALSQAVTAARRSTDNERALTASVLLAAIESERGEHSAALDRLRSAAAESERLEFPTIRVTALIGWSVALLRSGAPLEALPLAHDAYLGSIELACPNEEAAALCQISNIHGALGDSESSLDHARRAVRAAETAGDPLTMARARHRLAESRLAAGDPQGALAEYAGCLGSARAIDGPAGLYIRRDGLGETLLARGDATGAAKYAVLEVAERIRHHLLQSVARELSAQPGRRVQGAAGRSAGGGDPPEGGTRRRAPQVLREILESIPHVAIHAYLPNGDVAAWNRAAADLFGVPAPEAVGTSYALVLPAGVAESIRTQLAQATERTVPPTLTTHRIPREGAADRTTVASRFAVPDAAGRLLVCVEAEVSDGGFPETRAIQAVLRAAPLLEERLEAEKTSPREEALVSGSFEEIVGRSAPLRRVLHSVAQVAPTDAPVLILGETGVGKDLVARAVHARSSRGSRSMVTINCAALPATLIESELFGHEKGAFTGALARKIGRFEVADGSTIFLDEIGDLPIDLQAKLLRVLQQGEFERLGESITRRVDVRVIAATNRDLSTAIREGRFRADLYYRLAVFQIEVPPLRERRDDIPLLAAYLVSKSETRFGKRIQRIPESVTRELVAYDWPGNVRELASVVQRAVILSPGDTLVLDGVFGQRREPPVSAQADDSLEAAERAHIVRVLDECEWRIKGAGNAAQRLRLPPSTLRSRMAKLGIVRVPA